MNAISREYVTNESSGDDFQHFSRTLKALVHQPEYGPSAGKYVWWAMYQFRFLIYIFLVRRYKPIIYTVELENEVVGSISLTRSGEIANAVVTSDPMIKISVMRLLREKIDEWLNEHRYFRARTFETNRSLIRSLLRRGFDLKKPPQYVITIPLGPFAFSWITESPPKRISFLTVRKLCVLEHFPDSN